MRKRITLLVAALMMALTMSFSGLAFGFGHHEGCTKEGSIVTCPGKNKNWTEEQKGSTNSSHPEQNRNKGGNLPPGQN